MNIKSSDLIQLGAAAAQAFDEHAVASAQLEESFGVVYDAAKDNLLRDVRLADTQGLDLSVFAGDDSRFKFPQYNTNIVVRISKVPTPHAKLAKLAKKVEQLESELKLAKMQLKHAAAELIQTGQCDEVTDKIGLAFTRLRK